MALRPRQYQSESLGVFSADEAREIRKMLRRVRGEVRYPGSGRGKGTQNGRAPTGGFFKGVVTSTISPCTLSGSTYTYGSGTFQLVYSLTVDATTGTFDSDLNNLPISNWYVNSGSIGGGTVIWAVACDYAYWFVTADCPP